MSKFSGKCDLYDVICMQDDNPTILKGHCKDYNFKRGFDNFKKKTKGVLKMAFKLELSEFNIEAECENSKVGMELSMEEIPYDDNKKHRKKKYKYTYLGQEFYSLKELNKFGYYATREIKFEEPLDIVNYLPHIVSSMFSSKDTMTVYISEQPYPEREYYTNRQFGHTDYNHIYETYKKNLKEFVKRLVKGED